MNYIREKRIYCGPDHLEVDIYPITQNQLNKKGKRSKKKKESLPKQKRLNEKRARKRIRQITNTNFNEKDYLATLTHKKPPKTVGEALKERQKFLDRAKYHMAKLGLVLKYIAVTEFGGTEDNPTNIHHHIIINGGLTRDELEDLWSSGRGKNREPIGRANVRRLQPDKMGLAGLAEYITKRPEGKKRWTCSQNLERPESRENDHKYKRSQIIKAAMNNEYSKILANYKDYEPVDKDYGIQAVYNDFTGWSIYLRLRKKGSG